MKQTRIWQLGTLLTCVMLVPNAFAQYSKSFEGYGLFKKHCVVCHGSDGTGNGILAARLERRPANLTAASVAKKSDHEIFQIIEGTAPHSTVSEAMPKWGHAIPQNHIDSLVKYVRYLNQAKHRSTGNPVEGKNVYDEYCSACHGNDGKGEGTLAKVYNMRPADHTNAARLNNIDNKALKSYIETGIDDSFMPGWKGVLTDTQINDVMSYIRLLSASEK